MKNHAFKKKNAFTLVEIVVVLGAILILFSLISINLFRALHGSSPGLAAATLLSDIKSQQNKSMVGDIQGVTHEDNHGIFFGSNSYVLFTGSTYNPTSPTNITISLDQDLTISTALPGNILNFSELSGEIAEFIPNQNTITIKSLATSAQKTITINKYGVITQIQ